MKRSVFLLFVSVLLTGCSSVTYTKIEGKQPFIATVNIKDTSLTFLNEQYERIAEWDLDIPFTGSLLLRDGDTLLLYGKDMDSIEVFSLSKGKQIDSWKVSKGIINMKLLQNEKSIVAVNQSLNTVSFYNEKGQLEDQVKVGKGPLTVLQGKLRLYVINFDDTKLSIINVKSRKVEKEFRIHHSSTGALLREKQQELWIGGHGKGAEIEENVHIYSTETGELKRLVKAPSMPVNFAENNKEIFILSHGSSTLYKMDQDDQLVKRTEVGVNPFEMEIFHDDLMITSYDSNELYVIDTETVKIKKKMKVGKGPFQMISRE
jgi:YVTN family beta-propeller protein